MGLLWADSFDSYSVSSDLLRNWTGFASTGTFFNATAGRNGGGAFQTVASQCFLRTPLNVMSIVTNIRVGVCFWLKVSAPPSAATQIFNFINSGSVGTGGVLLATTGILQCCNSGPSPLAHGGINVCDNIWHWVEFTHSPTNGSPTLFCYVDGVIQWTGAFAPGATSPVVWVHIASPATQTFTMDDIMIFDDTVAEDPRIASMPLGPRRFDYMVPTSDDTVQFSRSAGSDNFALIDEAVPDDDSTYVQGASGLADLYGYGDLGFTPASVNGLQLVSRLKNPGMGTLNFKNRCVSGGTTSDGASTVTPSAYQNSRTTYSYNPDTASAWTSTTFNAAKFGIVAV